MKSSRMVAAVLAGVALLPGSGRGQTATDPATQQLNLAMRFQSEELFVPAITAWDKFLHDFPNDSRAAQASYNRGFCLFQTKQFDKAQDALRKVIERYPRWEQLDAAYLYLGMAQYNLGQPSKSEICDAAVQTFDTLAQKFPQSKFLPDALSFRAECLYLRGKKAEAAQSYADLAAKHASHRLAAHALYMAGFAALETGDYAAALRHAQAFLAAHPHDDLAADVMHVAAESQLLLGRFPESEQAYGQLLEKYPNHVDLSLWRVRHAMGLYLQKKYRETIAALEPAAASIHAPELVCQAQFLLGSSKLELNDPEAAARALEAALAADPKWRRADETRLALATAYRQAGRLDQARANLRRLIADFPASPLLDQAYNRLGESSYLLGDYRGAAEAYQALVDRWPQSPLAPQALYALAAAQLDQQNLAAAERSLDVLLAKSPEAKLAARGRFMRGQVRYQVRKYAEAADDLQSALAADLSAKEKSDARYLLGLCRMGLKQYPPAAAAFGELLQHDPQYARADTAQYQLAWALSLGGDDAKAAEAFARFVQKYPQNPRVAEAEYNVGELALKAKNYAKALSHYFAAQEKAGRTGAGGEGDLQARLVLPPARRLPARRGKLPVPALRFSARPAGWRGRLSRGREFFPRRKVCRGPDGLWALEDLLFTRGASPCPAPRRPVRRPAQAMGKVAGLGRAMRAAVSRLARGVGGPFPTGLGPAELGQDRRGPGPLPTGHRPVAERGVGRPGAVPDREAAIRPEAVQRGLAEFREGGLRLQFSPLAGRSGLRVRRRLRGPGQEERGPQGVPRPDPRLSPERQGPGCEGAGGGTGEVRVSG
jgi:TolA-binding protein